MKSIETTGKIDSAGNLRIYQEEVKDFCRKNKNCRVIIVFHAVLPGSSQALKGYYYNYVVPRFRRALWQSGDRRTATATELFMRELSPVAWEATYNEETQQLEERLRSIDELSSAELVEHIDTIKQIAAEEYSVYIEDPGIYESGRAIAENE